ncbi:MAG: cupin domain-containing protein [Acidimicrobiales bacterium]
MNTVTPDDDELSAVLRSVNVRSTVFCVSELAAPWGFRVEASASAKFHLLLSGTAVLTVEDDERERVPVTAGDLVLLPHGTGHVVQDQPASRVRRLERILLDHPVDDSARMRYGGRGPTTSMLCGGFDTGGLPADISTLLPRFLVLDGTSTAMARWIGPIFGLLRDERTREPPGSAAVLAKVADVLLTDVLRQFLAETQTRLALARVATVDAAIARAVRLLRTQPGVAWTVASLARDVGMSRTAFAARFRDVVGDSPIAYLAKVRLSHGAGLLATTRRSVAQVARAVGYDNEASFSKAFKRAYGRSPGAFRSERAAGANGAVAAAALLG